MTLNCAPWFLFICCILLKIDGSGYMNFVLTGHSVASSIFCFGMLQGEHNKDLSSCIAIMIIFHTLLATDLAWMLIHGCRAISVYSIVELTSIVGVFVMMRSEFVRGFVF